MDLSILVKNNQRVLTTAQIAKAYGTSHRRISENFNSNKQRYKEGKHFFLLQGNELKSFGQQYGNTVSVERVSKLYLWTEKGAWLHAKSLNSNQAWDAYEILVDDYYSLKDIYRLPTSYKEALLQLVSQVEKNEQLETQNLILLQQVNECQPKASYYDMVLQNKSLLSVSKIAKDYGMSAIKLNKLLHELGVQYKQGDIWLLYAKHQDKGYTQTHTHVIDAEKSKVQTKWTQKGRLFIYELLKQQSILPIIEREESAS
ncbi:MULTISPECIES: phage antirepressor KilAC domain-containing protein [Bacillus]|uniref:phage antirepressor KilAC domain-containing protein n=1 Tax=Bacillus TaxID=1386 RepID=UPI001F41EBD4|nr:phage antirepressor KilAC domain-containing protein [Bacillus altitudinis]MDH3176885.1 phage antirepressor KilAC domain-containing protein [Bacillus pumilus]